MTRRIDIEKRRPARWPWLVGVLALGLIGWGATVLLAPPDQPPPPEVGPSASDTLPPTAIPAPPLGGWPASRAREIETVAPLGKEDVGDTVWARGEVVATGNGAFWVVVGSEVVRVDSRRAARKGDTVSVHGVLTASDGETTGRIASEVLARSPRYDDWVIVPKVKLVEAPSASSPSDTTPGDPAASL